MHILLAVVAVAFIIAGFVGLVGGVVSIIFWALAALCIFGAAKLWFRKPNTPSEKGPGAP